MSLESFGQVAPALRGEHSQQRLSLDLNRATRAEIESARGVGVEMADRILEARAQRPFEDWTDFRRRVKRVTARTLAGLDEAGFTLASKPPPAP